MEQIEVGTRLVNVHGQPSWELKTDTVEAYVTRTGGHVGPVVFHLPDRDIQPFAIAPWAEEDVPDSTPPVERVLRGDFFCMPFGANETPFEGEQHPPHGEVANAEWELSECTATGPAVTMSLKLETKVRPGKVLKQVGVIEGHTAVYTRHTIRGMSGMMSMGHHAMLSFPDEPGSGIVSTSPIVFGQVVPEPLEKPENRGYSILKNRERFHRLSQVPLSTGDVVDLTQYPTLRGYEDLVMVVNQTGQKVAWTAVTFKEDGYIWFSLKDPRVLGQTVFWISNGGRHYPPWNGRHVGVLGLEDVTTYFHYGLAESAETNPLSEGDVPTCHELTGEPFQVNYITAVAPLPDGFERVDEIRLIDGEEVVELRDGTGKSVRVALDHGFIWR